jgi:hypothetical protein
LHVVRGSSRSCAKLQKTALAHPALTTSVFRHPATPSPEKKVTDIPPSQQSRRSAASPHGFFPTTPLMAAGGREDMEEMRKGQAVGTQPRPDLAAWSRHGRAGEPPFLFQVGLLYG